MGNKIIKSNKTKHPRKCYDCKVCHKKCKNNDELCYHVFEEGCDTECDAWCFQGVPAYYKYI